jgi:O-antigen/teichoic acid export membrane protein
MFDCSLKSWRLISRARHNTECPFIQIFFMTTQDVTQNIWRNSISNYVCTAIRMFTGLLMFRMLYQGLTREEFGFWALLWSVFGYGILLDFGFGFTAEKRVAELSVHQEWDRLSRILSTIFYLYVVVGILMVAAILLSSNQVISFFHITPANHEKFREILIWFFAGMAIAFPLGIFPEILIGQQRIWLTNIIFTAGIIGNFISVALAIHFHWSLKTIFINALLSGIIPCVISAMFAFQHLPKVKIRLGNFSWGTIRETMQFSLFAYVSTVSNIILSKTDQIVISAALTVSAVALYQAGAKLAETFGSFTHQLPSTFSPAAAHLHAKGDKTFLRQLLVNGTRFTLMIGTPLYFICAFYMEGLLTILTGDKNPNPETFWIGQVLLFWGYMVLVTQSVSKRIFMMCGHERRLMKFSVGEAALNLALSIGLVLYFKNVLCVALGSLISTMIFGWFFIWPLAAREAEMSCWQLARTVLIPIWLASLPLVAFLLLGRFIPLLDFRTSTILLLAQCIVATLIAAFCLWHRALTTSERDHLIARFGKFFRITPA